MQIYFSGNSLAKKHHSNYKMIIKALESLGHKVVHGNLFDEKPGNVVKSDYKLPERGTGLATLKKTIDEADLLVAEITNPSSYTVYEFNLALEKQKPIIGLIEKESGLNTLILGDYNEKVLVYKYEKNNIKLELENLIEELNFHENDKFSFIPGPILHRYLEWVTAVKNVSKNTFIKAVLEKEMKKDSKYKEFVKTATSLQGAKYLKS